MARSEVQSERRREWSSAIVAALALTLLAQLVRAYLPLAFDYAEDLGGTTGFIIGGAIGLAVFAAPGLAAVGGPAAGGRVALLGAMVVLGDVMLLLGFGARQPVLVVRFASAAWLCAPRHSLGHTGNMR